MNRDVTPALMANDVCLKSEHAEALLCGPVEI